MTHFLNDFAQEIQSLPLEQLKTLKLPLDNDIAAIKAQLDRAKAERHLTGEYADPDWWHRASNALRFKTRQVQMINDELKKRNAQKRKEQKLDIRNCFIDAARLLLPPEKVEEIFRVARDMMGGME